MLNKRSCCEMNIQMKLFKFEIILLNSVFNNKIIWLKLQNLLKFTTFPSLFEIIRVRAWKTLPSHWPTFWHLQQSNLVSCLMEHFLVSLKNFVDRLWNRRIKAKLLILISPWQGDYFIILLLLLVKSSIDVALWN